MANFDEINGKFDANIEEVLDALKDGQDPGSQGYTDTVEQLKVLVGAKDMFNADAQEKKSAEEQFKHDAIKIGLNALITVGGIALIVASEKTSILNMKAMQWIPKPKF